MTPAKEEILCKKYPDLFRDGRISFNSTVIHFGIDCGDGWFDIIDEMCHKLASVKEVYFTQIKEKYGTLCVNTCGLDENNLHLVFDAILEAEDKSKTTCELCGREGELSGSLWYQTRCKSCK